MKFRNIVYLFLFLCFFCGCGSIVNQKYYTPIYNGEKGFPNNGKGLVKITIIHNEWTEAENVITQWRRLNDDKTEGKMLLLTGSWGFYKRSLYINSKPKTETWMLDPGTYVLANFAMDRPLCFFDDRGSWWKRTGWDKDGDKPFYASFTVKAGETILLPTITIELPVMKIGETFNAYNAIQIKKNVKVKKSLLDYIDDVEKHTVPYGEKIVAMKFNRRIVFNVDPDPDGLWTFGENVIVNRK